MVYKKTFKIIEKNKYKRFAASKSAVIRKYDSSITLIK